MDRTEPQRRWYFPTPARLIVLSLATTGFLFLSERGKWFAFNEHKGWTVLIAVASVVAVLAVMLLWWHLALVSRRRFQFSIRSLLVLTLAVALPCSWLADEMTKAKQQDEAVKWINSVYDQGAHYWEKDEVVPRAEPTWLLKLLGDSFFAQDITVILGRNGVTVATLKHLRQIRFVRKLVINSTPKIMDAELENLRGLAELRELNLYDANITDAGLELLKGMTQLRRLSLNKSVTDAGVKRLQQALPNCIIARRVGP
jgi:hypothetical protein